MRTRGQEQPWQFVKTNIISLRVCKNVYSQKIIWEEVKSSKTHRKEDMRSIRYDLHL